MAPCSHVPLRPKFFHCLSNSGIDAKSRHPQHGHFCEYLFDIISIAINVLFVVGSACFFDDRPLWVTYVGDWLFIVGSVITFVLAAWAAYESWLARHAGSSNDSACQGQNQDDLVENLFNCAASLIFAAGCVLFMPGIYSTRLGELRGHEAGAWCFILGSFGFVMSSYWNALSMAAERGRFGVGEGGSAAGAIVSRITSVALCCNLLGSVFFVVGSFLYRPGYAHTHGCGRSGQSRAPPSSFLGRSIARAFLPAAPPPGTGDLSPPLLAAIRSALPGPHRSGLAGALLGWSLAEPEGPWGQGQGFENPYCASTTDHGTWLYVIGSCLFLLQSFLCLSCSLVLHSISEVEAMHSADEGRALLGRGLGDAP